MALLAWALAHSGYIADCLLGINSYFRCEKCKRGSFGGQSFKHNVSEIESQFQTWKRVSHILLHFTIRDFNCLKRVLQKH